MPTRRRAAAAILAVAVVLAGLLALLRFGSCAASGPESPEALFAELQAAMSAGRPGAVYDLTSEDFKRRWREAIENTKNTALKNPGARGMNVHQFQVTYDELFALSYAQIFERAHSNMEKVLPGARIIDKTTDPVDPDDVWIVFEIQGGQRFRWVMREEPGRGWRLKSAVPVKLE